MSTAATIPAAPVGPTSRDLAQALIVGVGFCAFFSYFLMNQARFSLDPDWSHAYLVPVISLYYIYENRERIFRQPRHMNLLGLPVVLAGMLVYFFFTLGPTWNHTFQGAGMIITLLGLVLLMLGWRMWTALLFPMLYLVVGIRMPPRILLMFTPTLQVWASKGSYVLLNIIGYDTERSGTVLSVWHNGGLIPLNVAEACSGMRTIVSFLALGIAIAFLGCKHWWQRVILIAMGIPVAIFINVLRVASIGVASTIDQDLAGGEAHVYIGMLWLIPAFALYMGILWVLQHIIIESDDKGEKKRTKRTTPPAPIFARSTTAGRWSPWPTVVCAFFVLSLGAFHIAQAKLGVFLHKEPVALRRPLRDLPRTVGSWQAIGQDAVLSPEVTHELGTEDYLTRTYAVNGDPQQGVLELHVAYYTGGIDAVPHIPDRCFVGGGMTKASTSSHLKLDIDRSLWWPDPDYDPNDPATVNGSGPYMVAQTSGGDRQAVRMPRLGSDGLTINGSEYWEPGKQDQAIAAGYLFVANGGASSSSEGVRLMAYDRSATHAYYCKVQLTLHHIGQAVDRQQLREAASDFLSHALPDLMRCLPDWVEVQRRAGESSTKTEQGPQARDRVEGITLPWRHRSALMTERWRRI